MEQSRGQAGAAGPADGASAPETKGIRRFRAYVLAENRRMLDVLARTTRVLDRQTERGITSLLLAPAA